MSLRLIFAADGDDRFNASIANWVKSKTDMNRQLIPGTFYAIGVVSDRNGGQFVAGLLFHDYGKVGTGGKIEVSMAAESARWAQKGIIRALLSYPFVQLGCHVLIATTSLGNKRTRKFLTGLGFEERGTIPNRPYADDTAIYALRRENAAKWLGEDRKEIAA